MSRTAVPCVWSQLTIARFRSEQYAGRPCSACGGPRGATPFTVCAGLGETVIGIGASFCAQCWGSLSSEDLEKALLKDPPYFADGVHVLDEESRDRLASRMAMPSMPLFEEGD